MIAGRQTSNANPLIGQAYCKHARATATSVTLFEKQNEISYMSKR
jgi:hypothetical protein